MQIDGKAPYYNYNRFEIIEMFDKVKKTISIDEQFEKKLLKIEYPTLVGGKYTPTREVEPKKAEEGLEVVGESSELPSDFKNHDLVMAEMKLGEPEVVVDQVTNPVSQEQPNSEEAVRKPQMDSLNFKPTSPMKKQQNESSGSKNPNYQEPKKGETVMSRYTCVEVS